MRFSRQNLRDRLVTSFNGPTRLVLELLRLDAPVLLRDRLHDLRPDEWQEFIALTRMQQVRPLIYFNLKSSGLLEAVPPELLLELHDSYLANLARNLQLYYDLKQISLWLREVGIPVIALKGAHLARCVYSNIALREMLDLDILVPRRHLVQAYQVIANQGYHPYTDACEDMEEWAKSNQHLVGLEKGSKHTVELHWHLEVPAHWQIEEFWERAVGFSYDGLDILSLCPEDLLLHLCHHVSYQHQFCMGLRPLLDICQVINHFGDRLDWGVIGERAERFGWSKGVWVALRATQSLVGVEAPDDCLKVEFEGDLRQMEEAAVSLVINTATWRRVPPNLALLWQEQSLTAKLDILWKRIVIAPEQLAAEYLVDPESLKRYWVYLARTMDLLAQNRWIVGRRGELDFLIRQNATLHKWLRDKT